VIRKLQKTALIAALMAAFAAGPGFLLAAPVQPAFAVQVDQNLQREIEDNLICQDGCGMILSACENQTAEYMRKIIVDRLEKGQTKDEIMGYFVSIYGDKVLAAPPAEGFNITAWVTPFVAILGGGLAVFFVLDKWVFYAKLERMDGEDTGPKPMPDLSEYEDKLDNELRKYL